MRLSYLAMDLPSTLELFLLAAVEEGCSTAYKLHVQAGLSVGSTQPALLRMVKKGWLSVQTTGSRGRLEHRITTKGLRELSSWRKCVDYAIQNPPNDLEGLCRLIAIVWQRGDKPRLKKLLIVVGNRVSEVKVVPFSSSLTGFHSWLSSLRSTEQHRSNLRLFKVLSAELRNR